MTLRKLLRRTIAEISVIEWRYKLKKAKLCLIARFWKRSEGLSWTRKTLGLRISRRCSSAWIKGCEKSTLNTDDSGLLFEKSSLQSAFFWIASRALVAYSSVTSALTSASFFLLVRRINSFSSTLRLMTVGGPTCFTQLSTSLASRLSPSIRMGVSPLSLTRVEKWAIILRKGSYSPSSGAINFSLIEATYGSYSIWRYPPSEAINFDALVLPTHDGPVTAKYFVIVFNWCWRGKSDWMLRRRRVSKKTIWLFTAWLNS